MDKKRKQKKDSDFAVTAFKVMQEATKEEKPETEETQDKTPDGKNPNAVALGRLGGLKGGKARASKLTPEQRKKIAQKAAKSRWEKNTQA